MVKRWVGSNDGGGKWLAPAPSRCGGYDTRIGSMTGGIRGCGKVDWSNDEWDGACGQWLDSTMVGGGEM